MLGDSAAQLVLDAYERVLGGPNDHRWRMEHAQVIHLMTWRGLKVEHHSLGAARTPRLTCIGLGCVWGAAAFDARMYIEDQLGMIRSTISQWRMSIRENILAVARQDASLP